MFKKIQIKGILLCLGLLSLSLVFTGSSCSSSDTDGGGDSGKEDSFVSTDDSTGTIDLSVNSTRLGIGDTSGFFVTVRDVNGGPVDALRISCDTEIGLALIEPTTGFELTDSFGNMSGVVGCEAPGSFQIACRLPVGGNKRKFETIVCSGDVPADFTGFPGAGGGGLGGGVDTTDSEDDEFSVRVSSINLYDEGNVTTESPAVDIARATCDSGDPEPFFDTSVGFEMVNNTTSVVRVESYTYTIADFDGAGSSYTSGRIFFLGEAQNLDANGGSTEVVALFIEANSDGTKSYFGRSDSITDQGFKNITFNIRATNSEGETINIEARVAISIGTFDRC